MAHHKTVCAMPMNNFFACYPADVNSSGRPESSAAVKASFRYRFAHCCGNLLCARPAFSGLYRPVQPPVLLVDRQKANCQIRVAQKHFDFKAQRVKRRAALGDFLRRTISGAGIHPPAIFAHHRDYRHLVTARKTVSLVRMIQRARLISIISSRA